MGDDSGPLVEAVQDLAFGELDGAEAYTFGRVTSVTMDGEGRIYVADGNADEIRVFDETGEYRFAIGREGAGPGELRSPCCLAIDDDGWLWVRDTGNSRYNRYEVTDDGARFVESRRMAHGAAGLWSVTTLDADGNLIDVGVRGGDDARVRFHVNAASDVVRTTPLPQPPEDSLGIFRAEVSLANGSAGMAYFYQPFGPRLLIAHSPLGGWAHAISSRYAVHWVGAGDAFAFRVVREINGPLLTAEERLEARERLARDARRWGKTLADMPFEIPDRRPPIRQLLFDAMGRLWVQHSVGSTQANRADVYERSGERSVAVTWPVNVQFDSGYLGDGVGVGIARDELDVQSVVRVRWREP